LVTNTVKIIPTVRLRFGIGIRTITSDTII
jgi:hypothetical protein